MGWEYHNRSRDRRGRFTGDGKRDQVHIRVTEAERFRIQGRATARCMDVSEYLLDLVQRDMLRETYGIELPEDG